MQNTAGRAGNLSPLAMFSRSFSRKGKAASSVQGSVKATPSFPWMKSEPTTASTRTLKDLNSSGDGSLPLSVQPGEVTPPNLSPMNAPAVDFLVDLPQGYQEPTESPNMTHESPGYSEKGNAELFPPSWATPPRGLEDEQDVGKENSDKVPPSLSSPAPPSHSSPATKSGRNVFRSPSAGRARNSNKHESQPGLGTPPGAGPHLQRAASRPQGRVRSASVPPGSPKGQHIGIDGFTLGQTNNFALYDADQLDMGTCSSEETIKVLVRVRPLNARENAMSGEVRCLRQESKNSVLFLSHPEPQHYAFDSVLGEKVSQESIFKGVGGPLVEKCLSGYNSSIFAYGQTGSGKTHTMLGDIESLAFHRSENRGLIPRVFEYLFERILQEENEFQHEELRFVCKCSFLEIYNEQVTDLLEPSSTNLQIREDAKRGIFVEGLKEVHVQTVEDVIQLIVQGAANRKTGATNMNRESSRSHSVFTCLVESKRVVDSVINLRFSKLNLIDLAGSERQKSSGAEGERLKEAGKINKSLLQLGKVIKSLTDGHTSHVPYRDSRLTFLLKESLGGNSKTTMIANISPSVSCFGETLSTLRFAHKVKNIRNRAVVNEDTTGDVAALKKEIHRLKEELYLANNLLQRAAHAPEPPASTGENHLAMVPFEEQTPPKRSASKKMKAMEAILAGALRREQAADETSKRLAAEIQQLNRLVRQREQDTQSGKLVLKFREEKIRRLEAVAKGGMSNDAVLEKDNESLREELNYLKSQLDRNPEVTRFALENLRLVEQLRKYQEFYDGGERDAMTEDIENLRDQLADLLEGRGTQMTPVMQRSTPFITQMELYRKDAEEAQNKFLMLEESNLNLQNQVQALTEEVERLLDVQTSLRADLGSQKEMLLFRDAESIMDAVEESSGRSRCPKKSLADAFASVGGKVQASTGPDPCPAGLQPGGCERKDEIKAKLPDSEEHILRIEAENKLAEARHDLQDALLKLEDKAVLQEALEDAQANLLEALAHSKAERAQMAAQVEVLQEAQVELAREMEKAKEEAIMERMMLEKEGERAENLEIAVEELEKNREVENKRFKFELQTKALQIITLHGIVERLQGIMRQKQTEDINMDETRSDVERETALALASLQEEIMEAQRMAAAAAEKEIHTQEVIDSTRAKLQLAVQELRGKVDTLEETVKALTLERDELQESLQVSRQEKESLQAQLDYSDSAVLSARRERDEANAALEEAQRETVELKTALRLAEDLGAGDADAQARATLQKEEQAMESKRLAEELAEARRAERLAQVALRGAEERLQAAIAAQEEKCKSLEECLKAEVTAKEEELSKLQWKLDVGTAAKAAAESDLIAANQKLEQLAAAVRDQEEKAEAEQREHEGAECKVDQLYKMLEVTVAERDDTIERLKEQVSAAAAAKMEAEESLTWMKVVKSEKQAAAPECMSREQFASVIGERDQLKSRVDLLEAAMEIRSEQLMAAKQEIEAEVANSNHLTAQISVLQALVTEAEGTQRDLAEAVMQLKAAKDEISRKTLLIGGLQQRADSATQTEAAFESAMFTAHMGMKEKENTIAALQARERDLEESVRTLLKQLEDTQRRNEADIKGKAERKIPEQRTQFLACEDTFEEQENIPCVQTRTAQVASPKFGNGSTGDAQQRIHELEEELQKKQKEVTGLRMRLMESEGASHDYVRSMVGAKMVPPLSPRRINGTSRAQTPPTTPTGPLSPLPPSSPRLGRDVQLAKSPRGGRSNVDRANRDMELQVLKNQLSEYLVEREGWVNEINRRQSEACAARVTAAKLRQLQESLVAENESLQRRDKELTARNAEVERQLQKLSGQQNLSQRIHHHAKIKEENNLLRSQLSANEEELRKERAAKSRAMGELAHLRAREGMPKASLYEEEEKLRKLLERAEDEKLMTTQTLTEVCQVVMKASGEPMPQEVDPNAAIHAVQSLMNRIRHAEHEIDQLRLKERLAEEKKRIEESWQKIRGSPTSNGHQQSQLMRSPSAAIAYR